MGDPGGTPRPASRWWVVAVLLSGLFLMGVGVLLVSAGQADDSPGLGGLGMINGLIGVVMVARQLMALRRPR